MTLDEKVEVIETERTKQEETIVYIMYHGGIVCRDCVKEEGIVVVSKNSKDNKIIHMYKYPRDVIINRISFPSPEDMIRINRALECTVPNKYVIFHPSMYWILRESLKDRILDPTDNSIDEIVRVLKYAGENGYSKIIIVTSDYHSWKVRFLANRLKKNLRYQGGIKVIGAKTKYYAIQKMKLYVFHTIHGLISLFSKELYKRISQKT